MREDAERLEVAYREGIRLFNAGHYWHAHEQWEYCWLRVEGEAATFYKAIIQTAAALVKWQQGNQRGLALNWAKSRRRLLSLPDQYQGLDLVKLRQAMDALDDGASEAPPVLMVVQ